MTATNFNKCRDHVLKWEGGYVNHPRDPGGATNYGVTHKTLARHRKKPVTNQDVRNLDKREAGEIFRSGYWNTVRGDDLPAGLDLVAFDAAVNSGPVRGKKWLQRALGVLVDGRIGDKTILAANTTGSRTEVIQKACAARMSFLRQLRTWSTFGRGWARRVADTEAVAVAMAVPSVHRLEVEAQGAQKAAGQQRTAGVSVAGGGVASGLSGLPEIAIWACLGVALIVAGIMALRAVHHSRRAQAYARVATEVL